MTETQRLADLNTELLRCGAEGPQRADKSGRGR